MSNDSLQRLLSHRRCLINVIFVVGFTRWKMKIQLQNMSYWALSLPLYQCQSKCLFTVLARNRFPCEFVPQTSWDYWLIIDVVANEFTVFLQEAVAWIPSVHWLYTRGCSKNLKNPWQVKLNNLWLLDEGHLLDPLLNIFWRKIWSFYFRIPKTWSSSLFT